MGRGREEREEAKQGSLKSQRAQEQSNVITSKRMMEWITPTETNIKEKEKREIEHRGTPPNETENAAREEGENNVKGDDIPRGGITEPVGGEQYTTVAKKPDMNGR